MGASATQGGLIIDLKKLNKVVLNKDVLSVTAQGGCRAMDVEAVVDAEGLYIVMGSVNDTGIGGLSLGGGSGFLTGQHGFVVDNILAMKIVLADGSVVEASKDVNPDLFWGMRGAGTNFGIVTEFTYKVHKQRGDVTL
jgi:FAD/FMN-containing dehydrogenase